MFNKNELLINMYIVIEHDKHADKLDDMMMMI